MAKRNIFDELIEGVSAIKGHRERKITLRNYKVEPKPLPKVDSKLIKETREKLHCFRAVFARKLRINERALEKWEQGRGRPNRQAAAPQDDAGSKSQVSDHETLRRSETHNASAAEASQAS